MPSIFVTNKSDKPHVGFFDGVAYEFPTGEAVAVPAEAATHMLGFNVPDKTEVLQRLGWTGTLKTKRDGTSEWVEDDAGAKRLAKFIFTKATLVAAPEEAPLA